PPSCVRWGRGGGGGPPPCRYDPWFLREVEAIVAAEGTIKAEGLPANADGLLRLKQMGSSDARRASLTGLGETEVAQRRRALQVQPVYKRIDTCAGEFASATPYM